MSDKKKEDEPIMEGSFSVNLSELRPVDQIFPDAHRPVAIATGMCVSPPLGCGQRVSGFNDETSAREYKITGMCQGCQDKFYAEVAEGEEMADAEDEFGPFGPGGEA